jgi:uncharacterized membrane protein
MEYNFTPLKENKNSILQGTMKTGDRQVIHLTTRRVVKIAIIAALYAVFTVALAPISYGPIQFRVSEILKVFVLFDPYTALGIGIGTFIANLASPFVGPWELIWMPLTDMAGGLLAWGIYQLLRKHWPVVPLVVYALTTGSAVGTMLYVFGSGGIWFLIGTVSLSEIVILLAGIPIIFGIARVLKTRGIQFLE